jgi:CRISPR-associated protein Cmr3
VGAIRATLARGQGWDGKNPWKVELNTVLGNGFDDLGQLCFFGPYLALKKPDDVEYLYPIPLHILGYIEESTEESKSQWIPACFLAPNDNKYESDIGEISYPKILNTNPSDKKLAPGEDVWITQNGLQKVLSGKLPSQDECFKQSQLWKPERRIGLEREYPKHTAKEGMLYTPEYVRLCENVELVMEVEGNPDDWSVPELVPLGGESRMASIRKHADIQTSIPTLSIEFQNRIQQEKKLTVSLLTPMQLNNDNSKMEIDHLEVNKEFPNLPGSKILSACVGKPQRIGGWDSLKKEPIPSTPLIPAGSTWFCEWENVDLEKINKLHGNHIGLKTNYGFGQIVLGTYPSLEGAQT